MADSFKVMLGYTRLSHYLILSLIQELIQSRGEKSFLAADNKKMSLAVWGEKGDHGGFEKKL